MGVCGLCRNDIAPMLHTRARIHTHARAYTHARAHTRNQMQHELNTRDLKCQQLGLQIHRRKGNIMRMHTANTLTPLFMR